MHIAMMETAVQLMSALRIKHVSMLQITLQGGAVIQNMIAKQVPVQILNAWTTAVCIHLFLPLQLSAATVTMTVVMI
jgi:hypothetical protein